MKNPKVSLLDNNQIASRIYDEDHDAHRVMVIGHDLNVDSDKIAQAIKEGMKDIKIDQPIATMAPSIQFQEIPTIVKELEIKEIEKTIYLDRIQVIETQVVVPEIRVVEIEKQIVVKDIQLVEVTKLIKELEPIPMYFKVLFCLQTLALVLSAISQLIKK